MNGPMGIAETFVARVLKVREKEPRVQVNVRKVDRDTPTNPLELPSPANTWVKSDQILGVKGSASLPCVL